VILELFSAASSHTLATSPTLVKNVRSIVVGGVTLKLKTNYTVAYDTGVISFVAAQTGAYTIGYDTGATDKIFPDFPKTELKISSYPRISVDITSIVTDDNDLSGSSNISGILISVYVYGIGKEQTMDMIKVLDKAYWRTKSFYVRYVTPISVGPMINEPFRGTKVFTKVLELSAPLNVEVIS